MVPGTCWWVALLTVWALNHLPTSLLQTPRIQTRFRNGCYSFLAFECCSSGFSRVLLLLPTYCSHTGLCFRKRSVPRKRMHSYSSVCYLTPNGGWQIQDGGQTLLRNHKVLLPDMCHVSLYVGDMGHFAAFWKEQVRLWLSWSCLPWLWLGGVGGEEKRRKESMHAWLQHEVLSRRLVCHSAHWELLCWATSQLGVLCSCCAVGATEGRLVGFL